MASLVIQFFFFFNSLFLRVSKKLIHLMERSSTIQEVVSAFVAICFGVTLRDRTWTRRCDNKAKEPFTISDSFASPLDLDQIPGNRGPLFRSETQKRN